jgi:hypothetical protein
MSDFFSVGKETEPAAIFVSAIISLVILVLLFFNSIPTYLTEYAIGFLIFHVGNHIYVLYPRHPKKKVKHRKR